MNYEELSFGELQELLKTDPEEFHRIPLEFLRKKAKEHYEEHFIMKIDDSSIRIY